MHAGYLLDSFQKIQAPWISAWMNCYLTLYIQGDPGEGGEGGAWCRNQQKGIVNLMRHKLLTRHPGRRLQNAAIMAFFERERETYDFVLSTLFWIEGCRIPWFVSPAECREDWEAGSTLRYAKEFQRYLQKSVDLGK